jgi:hypothetical protein
MQSFVQLPPPSTTTEPVPSTRMWRSTVRAASLGGSASPGSAASIRGDPQWPATSLLAQKWSAPQTWPATQSPATEQVTAQSCTTGS